MFHTALPLHRVLFSCAALTVLGCAVAASPANAQNLLTNGSFENVNSTYVDNHGGGDSLGIGSTSITGWTVVNNELAWLQNGNPYGLPSSDGTFSLDLTGYHDSSPYGGVQQTIATTIGRQYALSFDLGVQQSNGSYIGPNGVTASAAGVSQTFTYNPAVAGSAYGRFTLNFTANAGTTTISLIGAQSGGGSYIGLDNASVVATSAVPEPGSVAMLVGLSVTGAGFLSRRRRRQAKNTA